MMSTIFEVRNTSSKVADAGAEALASITKFGDVVTMDWQYNLMLQGRVFIGGEGIEATDVDGEGTLDETKPTWLLRAPASGTLIVPLYVRLQLTTEGGAAPDAYLGLVSPDSDDGIAFTSGTQGASVLNALGGQHNASAAKFSYTNVVGTITSAQNVILWQTKDTPTTLLTVVAVDVDGGSVESLGSPISSVEIPLFPHIPIALNKDAMLCFWTATASSDSKYRPTFVWAEIPDDIL
jgi:hypothetical protein